jgi:uncharacterized DUF497 family protein
MGLEEVLEEGIEVDRDEVKCECRKHGVEFADLVEELGDKDIYFSRDVMLWLGY